MPNDDEHTLHICFILQQNQSTVAKRAGFRSTKTVRPNRAPQNWCPHSVKQFFWFFWTFSRTIVHYYTHRRCITKQRKAKKERRLEALGQCIPLPGHDLPVHHLRISMSSRFMSVNHFPYVPVVANPENNPCTKTVIQVVTPKFNHFVHRPIVNLL